jgi:hypothetical protein
MLRFLEHGVGDARSEGIPIDFALRHRVDPDALAPQRGDDLAGVNAVEPAEPIFVVDEDGLEKPGLGVAAHALKILTLGHFVAGDAFIDVFADDRVAVLLGVRNDLAALAVDGMLLTVGGHAVVGGRGNRRMVLHVASCVEVA